MNWRHKKQNLEEVAWVTLTDVEYAFAYNDAGDCFRIGSKHALVSLLGKTAHGSPRVVLVKYKDGSCILYTSKRKTEYHLLNFIDEWVLVYESGYAYRILKDGTNSHGGWDILSDFEIDTEELVG